MKKAVLYARVSGDLQAKEGTIESQVLALKKQIATAGHVLVKEYIDNGFSGPRLDRPGLDELRRDLRTPLFDIIYFLDADRIAREVTIQTLLIEEILKHRKELVINGKDYVKNPENHFTLIVLGAVAELERAKIIERATRGKQLRLMQGQLLGCGNVTFGYDFLRRTPTSPPRMIVNEQEAATVRYVFETYASGDIGLDRIAQQLEERGVAMKTGKRLWRRSFLKDMLHRETYLGVKYFNTVRFEREYATPLSDIKHSTVKRSPRDREEWIGIKVPAIISRELFDRVQARLKKNQAAYRNPRHPALLSNLVQCGACGRNGFVLRRWVRSRRQGPICVIHRTAYKCNWRHLGRMHSKSSNVTQCNNSEIKAPLLEARVLAMVREVLPDPTKFRACMDVFHHAAEAQTLKDSIATINTQLEALRDQKRRVIDLYATGDIARDLYIEKSRGLDALSEPLESQHRELIDRGELIHQHGAIDAGVAQYCEAVRARLLTCSDMASMRRFLLEYVDKVVYVKHTVSLYGSVPIASGDADAPAKKLPFCIVSEITREERYEERMRVSEAMKYQQSLTRQHHKQLSCTGLDSTRMSDIA
jgi:site-specific DNA recombinase